MLHGHLRTKFKCTFKLLPSDQKCRVLEDDYNHMQEMIYGVIPEFFAIKNAIKMLEQEINLLE